MTGYDAFKEAQASGGPCANCGWREGDGIRACSYASSAGTAMHSNAHPERLMPPAERELWQLTRWRWHARLVFPDPEAQSRELEERLREFDAIVAKKQFFVLDADGRPVLGNEADAAARRAEITADVHSFPLGTDPEFRNCVTEPGSRNMVHVYLPHVCGGHARDGNYRVRCTGCDLMVRLGDYGVEEDYG